MATEKIPPGYNEDNEIGRKKGSGGSEYDNDSSYGDKHPEETQNAPENPADNEDSESVGEKD